MCLVLKASAARGDMNDSSLESKSLLRTSSSVNGFRMILLFMESSSGSLRSRRLSELFIRSESCWEAIVSPISLTRSLPER